MSARSRIENRSRPSRSARIVRTSSSLSGFWIILGTFGFGTFVQGSCSSSCSRTHHLRNVRTQVLVDFCDAAAQVGVPVVFRIKHTFHSYLVGNILDLGPSGIEVPQTETVETAQQALDYFYYPQVGIRSWGGLPRANVDEHPDRLDYAEYWNDFGVLWLQIESLSAVTRAKTFARPGVDCLSWGPADLSFNREANPEHPLKTDDDCIRHVVKLLEGSETKLCIRSYEPELRNKYLDMGATVLLERPSV